MYMYVYLFMFVRRQGDANIGKGASMMAESGDFRLFVVAHLLHTRSIALSLHSS